MATDGPNPRPCDGKIFKKGEILARIDGASNAVENWVLGVAKRADAKVDWHYAGGVANVLHLGDAKSRKRTLQAIRDLEPSLKGEILYKAE